MTNNPHDYQILMNRTKTSVVLIVLEYVLFPAFYVFPVYNYLLYTDQGEGHFDLHIRPPRLRSSLKFKNKSLRLPKRPQSPS